MESQLDLLLGRRHQAGDVTSVARRGAAARVRLWLGAVRRRLIRQLMTESWLLALAAAGGARHRAAR
jgi:hypothetical protein